MRTTSPRPVVAALLCATGLLAACGETGTPSPAPSGAATSGTPAVADTLPATQAAPATAGSPYPGCPATTPQSGPDNFKAPVTLSRTADGLQEGDLTVGCGPAAKAGSTVSVQYTGWLADGTKFDSSRDRGQPFDVTNLGQAQVIQGWNEGLVGMKPGGKRRLVIPGALAYGPNPPAGAPIPPNATLTFDIEALSVT